MKTNLQFPGVHYYKMELSIFSGYGIETWVESQERRGKFTPSYLTGHPWSSFITSWLLGGMLELARISIWSTLCVLHLENNAGTVDFA